MLKQIQNLHKQFLKELSEEFLDFFGFHEEVHEDLFSEIPEAIQDKIPKGTIQGIPERVLEGIRTEMSGVISERILVSVVCFDDSRNS